MQTYLINLDKDKDRLVAADAQLKRLGVEYERFPAVYAKKLPKEIIDSRVNYFRWWCCVGRKILPGEIGCALSHYSIYQKMIDERIEYACILEDDVVLNEAFSATLLKVKDWLDLSKPQVVLLSNHTGELEHGEEIREVSNGLCTEAYVLTLPAAQALLRENLPICVPCDHWGRWAKKGIIKLHLAIPSVCTQNWDGFESNMSESVAIKKVSDFPLHSRMLHKFKRLIGKSVDILLNAFGL